MGKKAKAENPVQKESSEVIVEEVPRWRKIATNVGIAFLVVQHIFAAYILCKKHVKWEWVENTIDFIVDCAVYMT